MTIQASTYEKLIDYIGENSNSICSGVTNGINSSFEWLSNGSQATASQYAALAGCGNTQQPSPRPSGVMRYQRSTSTT